MNLPNPSSVVRVTTASVAAAMLIFPGSGRAQSSPQDRVDATTVGHEMESPPTRTTSEGVPYPVAPTSRDRVFFSVTKAERGTTKLVPHDVISKYCGEMDGCTIRLGMYDWDGTGRVASRESLLFYNRVNHAWRVSLNDRAGTDYNGATEHLLQAWACFLTDGKYQSFGNPTDAEEGFGLLSWNQFNADCWLTIIH